MTHTEAFTSRLLEALSELEAAGFIAPAEAARDRCFSAYTTSSEWLGEVGASITELIATFGASIPVPTRQKLDVCLNEVAKVWPTFRAN
jgi:hypothetical protein